MLDAVSAELGWAAGMIDGEGTITIQTDPKTGRAWLVLSAANVSRRALEVLQRLFGGKISTSKRYSAFHSTCYVWKLFSRQAEAAIERLSSLLVIKGRQAALAVEFQRNMGTSGRNMTKDELTSRPVLVGLMRELNRRGRRAA